MGPVPLRAMRLPLGVLDFNFMAGSMGSVVGERLTRLIELAIEKQLPLIIISASGGARMQESISFFDANGKNISCFARLHEARLPYISVLTNPTSGGVTASFASLGDIIMAEPDALIWFCRSSRCRAGIRQKLPLAPKNLNFY